MKTTPTLFIAFALTVNTIAVAQGAYDFASTGQQKLLVNPAFCASEGVHVQAIGMYVNGSSSGYEKANMLANYAGVSFGIKNFGFGISNSLSKVNVDDIYYNYKYALLFNQTNLNLAYKINLTSKIALVPSIQGAYYVEKEKVSTTNYSAHMFTASPGLLLDINKMLTVGVAFYNVAKPEYTPLTQVYHASIVLFRERAFNFQPYAVYRRSSYSVNNFQLRVNYLDNQVEIGAFTTYKFVSLQTAVRSSSYEPTRLTAGLSFALLYFKFGYTFSDLLKYGTQHELYLAISPLRKARTAQRNLLLN